MESTREQRLEDVVRGLVAYLNETNQGDCLGGYHNSLGDRWVREKDSTTLNQELDALELPLLEEVETDA